MPGGPYPVAIGGSTGAPPDDVVAVFLSLDLIEAVQNKPVFFIVQTVAHPTAVLTVSGSLPAGLTFTDYGNGNGLVSGTPTGTGNSSVTVHATNTAGVTDQTLSFSIAAPPTPDYLIPTSIDSTGTNDVTTELLSFILAKPPGTFATPTVITFQPGGTYRVESQLLIPDRHHLVLNLNGATIKNTTTGTGTPLEILQRCILRFRRCDDIVVYGGVLQGANPFTGGFTDPASYVSTYEQQNALRFESCVDVEVSNMTIHNTYGDAVYLGTTTYGGGLKYPCDGVWVHDCEVYNTGRQGLSIGGAQNVVIELNDLHDQRRATFDFEPLTTDETFWLVSNVHVLNNTIRSHWLQFQANKGVGPNCDTIVWDGNVFDTSSHNFFQMYLGTPNSGARRSNYWVVNNTMQGAETVNDTKNCIQAFLVDGIVILNNTVHVQNVNYTKGAVTAKEPLAHLAYCSAVQCSGNTIGPTTGAQYEDWDPTGTSHTTTVGTPISPTPPAAPNPGRRATGGWTP